jgi:methionine synthase II (cobalamin-independent)
MTLATGVGSLPGTDIAEAVRTVVGELPDFVHLPELPARGAPASMIGRATALLSGLGADLQPAGWRLTDAPGADQRRALSLLTQDLDLLEEHTQGYAGRLKVQAAGPWSLAAGMERPRGDRVLADAGARRELAQSLAAGLTDFVADLRRRVPAAILVVQIDEPALPAVLAGSIPTASGFSRHRTVHPPVAVEALREVTDAVRDAGAVPVVHCCAADVPMALLRQAGAAAVSFDLSLLVGTSAAGGDVWAEAFDAGVDLWPGIVPGTDPVTSPSAAASTSVILRFVDGLGLALDAVGPRLVLTPACGLAGASPSWSRQAMRLVREVAALVGAESD